MRHTRIVWGRLVYVYLTSHIKIDQSRMTPRDLIDQKRTNDGNESKTASDTICWLATLRQWHNGALVQELRRPFSTSMRLSTPLLLLLLLRRQKIYSADRRNRRWSATGKLGHHVPDFGEEKWQLLVLKFQVQAHFTVLIAKGSKFG